MSGQETGSRQEYQAMDELDDTVLTSPDQTYIVDKLPVAHCTLTQADDEYYRMDLPRAGDCVIFTHDYFQRVDLRRRDGSGKDASLCKRAFEKLGFEVRVYRNLKTRDVEHVLEKASKKDHSQCNAFVVVFMSYGGRDNGEEFIHTYDSRIPTTNLWKPFLGSKCTSLAGKPKLIFIQANRGTDVDNGVVISVPGDSNARNSVSGNRPGVQVGHPGAMSELVTGQDTEPTKADLEYVVPEHADLLIMWASFEGLTAFRIERGGINGSVFLHFLANALMEEGTQIPLFDLLLKVTRQVAIQFESNIDGSEGNRMKQMPQLTSTLLRKVIFPQPNVH